MPQRAVLTGAGPGFQSAQWRELRRDIDPAVAPDMIGATADGSVDAVFSSHNIEHRYPHEVPLALKAFMRMLQPKGFAVITCPDLLFAAEIHGPAGERQQAPAIVA